MKYSESRNLSAEFVESFTWDYLFDSSTSRRFQQFRVFIEFHESLRNLFQKFLKLIESSQKVYKALRIDRKFLKVDFFESSKTPANSTRASRISRKFFKLLRFF